MPPSDVIETTVAEVTAELLRRGVGRDEPVSIIIEPVEGLTLARRKSRVRVVAAGLSDADIDRLIKQAQKEVEPNLAEAIRPRFAPLGGVDLEPSSHGIVDAAPSFDPSSTS
jgi:glycine/D-amino acid oxidase-like deaminating enzyme